MKSHDIRRTAALARYSNDSANVYASTGSFETALRHQWNMELQHGPVRVLMQDGKPVNKVVKTFRGQKLKG